MAHFLIRLFQSVQCRELTEQLCLFPYQHQCHMPARIRQNTIIKNYLWLCESKIYSCIVHMRVCPIKMFYSLSPSYPPPPPISDRASYISQFKIAMQQLRAAPDTTQERPCYVILYTCLCQTWCYPEAVTAFDLWTNTCCFQCHKTFCFSEFRLYSVCVVLDLTFVALFIWITFKFDRSKMNLSNIHVANSTSTAC